MPIKDAQSELARHVGVSSMKPAPGVSPQSSR
jgi:hypothetical protein